MEKYGKKRVFLKYFDSLIILMFAIAVWFLIPVMINTENDTDVFTSPSLFPKIISVSLIVLSLFQILAQYRIKQRSESAENTEQGEYKTFFVGILSLALYIFLIPILGFLLSTMISVFWFTYFFGKPKWYNALIFTILVSSIMYFSFSYFLNVPLPNPIFL